MANKIGWVDAQSEVVAVFKAGIGFGLTVARRRPQRDPQWSEDEWREALIGALQAANLPVRVI